MSKPVANSRVEKPLPTVATKLSATFCMGTVTSSKGSTKWSLTLKCVSKCRSSAFCSSLFRAFRANDALGGGGETVGPANVRRSSDLNEISHRGTPALPYGFGRIAGDFATSSTISHVLDE